MRQSGITLEDVALTPRRPSKQALNSPTKMYSWSQLQTGGLSLQNRDWDGSPCIQSTTNKDELLGWTVLAHTNPSTWETQVGGSQ